MKACKPDSLLPRGGGILFFRNLVVLGFSAHLINLKSYGLAERTRGRTFSPFSLQSLYLERTLRNVTHMDGKMSV